MICTCIAEPDFDKCLEMVQRAQMAEIRLDAMDISLSRVNEIFSRNDNLIATCRPGRHSEEARKKLLAAAVNTGAAYLDIEYESDENYRGGLLEIAREKGCKVIISYHNFRETPSFDRLEDIYKISLNMGADIVKIACQVNHETDVLNLLQVYKFGKNVLSIGMGRMGKLTRISGMYLGAGFTFAASDGSEGTAPGQLKYGELKMIDEILNQ